MKEKKLKSCARLQENLWASKKLLRGRKKKWEHIRKMPLRVVTQDSGLSLVHLQPNSRLYGSRLKAKQRLKKFYRNLTERQFKKLLSSSCSKGKPFINFLAQLERRLDTTLYRLNFASTLDKARQLISHGHVRVNGARVKVKSFTLRDLDLIQIHPHVSKELRQDIKKRIQDQEALWIPFPSYLEADYNTLSGLFVREPKLKEIPYPVQMQFPLVREYYQRRIG